MKAITMASLPRAFRMRTTRARGWRTIGSKRCADSGRATPLLKKRMRCRRSNCCERADPGPKRLAQQPRLYAGSSSFPVT